MLLSPVNGLLTMWSRKDKQIYKYTNIHTHMHFSENNFKKLDTCLSQHANVLWLDVVFHKYNLHNTLAMISEAVIYTFVDCKDVSTIVN